MIDLKRERERAGYTQESLASALDIARSTISMIELGERKPSPELAIKIGKLLNLEWKYFFEKESH